MRSQPCAVVGGSEADRLSLAEFVFILRENSFHNKDFCEVAEKGG